MQYTKRVLIYILHFAIIINYISRDNMRKKMGCILIKTLLVFTIVVTISQKIEAYTIPVCLEKSIQTQKQAVEFCSEACNRPYITWYGEWYQKDPACGGNTSCICSSS
jgi:hypothetical protein